MYIVRPKEWYGQPLECSFDYEGSILPREPIDWCFLDLSAGIYLDSYPEDMDIGCEDCINIQRRGRKLLCLGRIHKPVVVKYGDNAVFYKNYRCEAYLDGMYYDSDTVLCSKRKDASGFYNNIGMYIEMLPHIEDGKLICVDDRGIKEEYVPEGGIHMPLKAVYRKKLLQF